MRWMVAYLQASRQHAITVPTVTAAAVAAANAAAVLVGIAGNEARMIVGNLRYPPSSRGAIDCQPNRLR